MHTRPYQPSDLSTMADIMALNNHTDALARFIMRDIEIYPFTYRRGCLRFLKGTLLGKGTVCFVAETDPSDYPAHSSSPFAAKGGEVIAHAIWTRHGTSPQAREWQAKCNGSWIDALNRTLTGWEGKYQKQWPFSMNEHTFNHAHFNSVAHILGELWDPEVFGETWELDGLYTHNAWQQRGIGKLLMDWGKERAREEGVPIVVAGSPVGGVVYRKAGFREVAVLGLGEVGGFNELEYGGEVMRRWCWEPSEEGRWVERARENKRNKKEEKSKEKGKAVDVEAEGMAGITMGVIQ